MPKTENTASKATDLSGTTCRMSDVKPSPGEVIQLWPLGSDLKEARCVALVKTEEFEMFQVAVPSGRTFPMHELQGEVVVHCLQGRVAISALGTIHDLGPEQLLYYLPNEPFSIRGWEDAALLVTVTRRSSGENVELIG